MTDDVRMNGDGMRPTRVLQLIVAWALVSIPLGWGIWQVFKKSLALFH